MIKGYTIEKFNRIFCEQKMELFQYMRDNLKKVNLKGTMNDLIGKRRWYEEQFFLDNLETINNLLGVNITPIEVTEHSLVIPPEELKRMSFVTKVIKEKKPEPWDTDDDYFYYIKESTSYDNSSRQKALAKNAQLIDELYDLRENALGIGTRKMKIRLNKIAVQNIEAKIARMVLEIEDVSTQAKNTSWKYKDKKYFQKQELIEELVEIYKQTDYDYGIQYEENYNTNAILYFELPNGSQVSFHTNWDEEIHVKKYEKKWDGLINSTFKKVITFVEEKFINEIVKEKDKKILTGNS
jgi:hypothetical protein